MLKSNKPRMLSCGTPELTGSLVDRAVFIRTNWYREVKLLPSPSVAGLDAPMPCILARSI